MAVRHPLAAIALAALSLSATAEDYLGVLRPARAGLAPPSGVFALGAESITNGLSPFKEADQGFRLKLGYQYSRYFSVEGNFLDLPRAPADIFSNPTNFSSAFRSSAVGVDTIATLPVWRSFSFYGRLGAYRGDAPRSPFATYSTSLLNDTARTRWRYGLGMRYDFTSRFGVRAELERYAPMGSPLSSEGPDSDQLSVGFAWRF
jgi:outer membrane protein with beta-barrel domain